MIDPIPADTHAWLRSFPANRSAPRAAAAWLRSLGGALGLAPERVGAAELCLDEIVTNVVRHAWIDPDSHALAIRIERELGSLTVTVEDDGRPFDPRRAPTPATPTSLDDTAVGGRGIALVRSFAREMRYERVGGLNRLIIVLPAAVAETPGP